MTVIKVLLILAFVILAIALDAAVYFAAILIISRWMNS